MRGLLLCTFDKSTKPNLNLRGIASCYRNDKTQFNEKHCENREKVPGKHFIGCRGVKLFLLKDVAITTVTSATVTTITITTITI